MNAVHAASTLAACLFFVACPHDPQGEPPDCPTPSTGLGAQTACLPAASPPSPSPELTTCSDQPVWFSELHVDPPGPDGDGRDEFLELQTLPHTILDGWSVVFVDGASDRVYMQVALLGRADADGRFVVGGANVPGAQAFPPGTIQNGPDAVQVVDCHNRLFDELGYGATPSNSLIQRWVPRAPQGQSVHACGTSGAGPASVFVHAPPTANAAAPPHAACGDDPLEPTPVAPTQPGPPLSPTPSACDPTPGIRFSEVFYDAVGIDGGHEFLEFSGPVGASLAGWWVEAIDGRTGTSYRTLGLADLVVDANGLALLHDQEGVRLGLQNGPDALVLRTCDDDAQDALVYGVFGPTDVPLPTTWGPSVGTISAGSSWVRCPDNGDNYATGTPSPGLPNALDESGGCHSPAPSPGPDPLPDTDLSDTDQHDAGAPDARADDGAGWRDASDDVTAHVPETSDGPRDTGSDVPPDLPAVDCLCEGRCPNDPRRSVWIDELFVDPEGADDPTVEFVELRGAANQRLDGMALVAINGANDETYLRVSLDGYRLDANGRLVIGGQANGLAGPTLPSTLQNGPDAVALQACMGDYQSGVSYGRHTRPPNFPDVLVSAPPAGSSMQRCPGGDERPRYVRTNPTPGAPPADLAASCATP